MVVGRVHATYLLSFFRQPHSGCEATPQPDDDALNLEATASTASKEGDELHYACKAGTAIERSNPDLASDGTSFVLGCSFFQCCECLSQGFAHSFLGSSAGGAIHATS